MGSTASSFQSLATDTQLLRLVSTTHVSAGDADAWDRLLKWSGDVSGYVFQQYLPVILMTSFCNRGNAKLLEDSLTPLMEQLLQNNTSSHNVSSLVTLFEEKCQELRSLDAKDER